jgi:uncharacterized protein
MRSPLSGEEELLLLEMRPQCESCERPLPPSEPGAVICSYECTFCIECAEQRLHRVCPNCGGGLEPRPTRQPRS